MAERSGFGKFSASAIQIAFEDIGMDGFRPSALTKTLLAHRHRNGPSTPSSPAKREVNDRAPAREPLASLC